MPEICRFYGIIIRMYKETGVQHHIPHIHAYYQEYVAVFSIPDVELLTGELPRRQQRFVEAWMEMYQEELMENWALIEAGEEIHKLPPLS